MAPEPKGSDELIYIDLAEVEVLRLVDLEGMYQEQAGSAMGVSADAGKMEAAIVHIANALANRSDLGGFFEIPPQDVYIDDAAWAEVRLDPTEVDLDQLISEAGLQFADSVNVFCG